MKKARVVILAVALIAGLTAAYLAMNLVRAPADASLPPTAINTVDVLVAAKDIPVGTNVDATALEWRAWPDSGVSPTYIVRSKRPNGPTELGGTIARGSFFAGEPITEAKLVHTDRGFMSAILPPGKVAVATTTSASTGAGGFILPNDHVDVIMTRAVVSGQAPGGAAEQKLVPETILTNVRVLAIDQTVMEQNGKQVVVGQTATLELSPQQAEIITVAQRISEKLTLALRSLSDSQSSGPDASHLIGGSVAKGVTIVRNGLAREVETVR